MNCYDMSDFEAVKYHVFTSLEILHAINNGVVLVNGKKYRAIAINNYPELKYYKQLLDRVTNDMRMGHAPQTFPILYKTVVYENKYIFIVNNFETMLSSVQDSINIVKAIYDVNTAIKYMSRKGYTLYNLTIFNVYKYEDSICINLFDNIVQTFNKNVSENIVLTRFINTFDKKYIKFIPNYKNPNADKIKSMFVGLEKVMGDKIDEFYKFDIQPGVFYDRKQFQNVFIYLLILKNVNPTTIPSIKTQLEYLDVAPNNLEFYTWYITLMILLINNVALDAANLIAKGRVTGIDDMISKILPCVTNSTTLDAALKICPNEYKTFVAALASVIYNSDSNISQPLENWLNINYL
jgi:hypothetical protein